MMSVVCTYPCSSTQSFLDPRGRIPAQLLKGEWNVLNLFWDSGVVMQVCSILQCALLYLLILTLRWIAMVTV
jgi:hypothetical protein